MRLNEIANAQDQLGLLRLIIDNTWSAIRQQAEIQSKQQASKTSTPKPKAIKPPKRPPYAPPPKPLPKPAVIPLQQNNLGQPNQFQPTNAMKGSSAKGNPVAQQQMGSVG